MLSSNTPVEIVRNTVGIPIYSNGHSHCVKLQTMVEMNLIV